MVRPMSGGRTTIYIGLAAAAVTTVWLRDKEFVEAADPQARGRCES